jgi:hypothetical protein
VLTVPGAHRPTRGGTRGHRHRRRHPLRPQIQNQQRRSNDMSGPDGHPQTDGDDTTDPGPPGIDLTPSLGMAGHEQELLGLQDVADTADINREDHLVDGPSGPDAEDRVATDIATRGGGHAG